MGYMSKYDCLTGIDFIDHMIERNLSLKTLSQCPSAAFVVWMDLEAGCADSAVAAEVFGRCG